MKKTVLLAFVLALLSTPGFVGLVRPVSASLPVHNIDSGLDYATIQEAMDANETLDGHTILVDAGIYYGHVSVSKSIALIGESKVATVIDGNGTRKVVTVTAQNVTIAGFTIQGSAPSDVSSSGIYIGHSNGNNISHNILTSNRNGIMLEYSNNSILIDNIASNNTACGVILRGSNNNNIVGNNASNQEYTGIYLDSSNNNTLAGNIASNNENGIMFWYLSNNNTLTGNIVSNNTEPGIYLFSSNNNTLVGNNVSNNKYGISLTFSCNNRIFHNNLINNLRQVSDRSWDNPDLPPSTNFWTDGYPSGGNYWSDYKGTDLYSGPYQNVTGSDGIGDTAYDIDENNQDNYPLMGMFSDFSVTLELHVQTVSNSSISDFQFNGTAISFNVTGENGTTGLCRICIPTALLNVTYKVFVNGTEVPYTVLPCSNSTQSYLYFTYNHSTQEVIIIPEFPTWTLILLIVIVLACMLIFPRLLHDYIFNI